MQKQTVSVLMFLSFSLACATNATPTPVEKLVDKFGQNFNPNDYGHIVDSAYEIADGRDADPGSSVSCQEQKTADVNTDELIDYLIHCRSRQRVLEFFTTRQVSQDHLAPAPISIGDRELGESQLKAQRSVRIDDIVINEKLFQIYALLGKDPELYTTFVASTLAYRGWDLNKDDTFRHPIASFRSGWADCDDFTVEHYFWAHLHDLSPNLVVAVDPEENVTAINGVKTVNAHSFVTYKDTNSGKMIVLDNYEWKILGKEQSVQDYLEQKWPDKDLTIQFNGPYTGGKD